MSVEIPASHLDLIAGPILSVMTTVNPDGKPENTAVWSSWDGTHILINTIKRRRKYRNIENNPHVAITALDPNDPYHWVDVRGVVESIVPDENYANIDAHTRLYTEHDVFYGGYAAEERRGTEERVILKIKPERVLVYPHR